MTGDDENTNQGSDAIHAPRRELRSRYRLEDLLAQCDPTAPLTDEELEWLNSPPVGRECI